MTISPFHFQRERYWDEQSLSSTAKHWMDELNISRGRRQLEPFNPDHSACLLLDMQRYFFDSSARGFAPAAPFIIPSLNRLIQTVNGWNRPVILTRHLDSLHGTMATWWGHPLLPDDPFSELIPEMAFCQNVVKKRHYDAFRETGLARRLKHGGVRDLIIGGVLTHLCCETTARTAFMLGFRVWFLVDGTATFNATFHQATLQNLSHGFVRPVTIDMLLSAETSLSPRRE